MSEDIDGIQIYGYDLDKDCSIQEYLDTSQKTLSSFLPVKLLIKVQIQSLPWLLKKLIESSPMKDRTNSA